MFYPTFRFIAYTKSKTTPTAIQKNYKLPKKLTEVHNDYLYRLTGLAKGKQYNSFQESDLYYTYSKSSLPRCGFLDFELIHTHTRTFAALPKKGFSAVMYKNRSLKLRSFHF